MDELGEPLQLKDPPGRAIASLNGDILPLSCPWSMVNFILYESGVPKWSWVPQSGHQTPLLGVEESLTWSSWLKDRAGFHARPPFLLSRSDPASQGSELSLSSEFSFFSSYSYLPRRFVAAHYTEVPQPPSPLTLARCAGRGCRWGCSGNYLTTKRSRHKQDFQEKL